ncbi:MAG: FAD-dependent oxidoreductase, partial [Massilia sp.]
KRVVVAGSGPLLLAVADTVRRSGGEVVAIAEQRDSAQLARFGARLALRHQAKFMQAVHLMAALRSVSYLRGALVTAAHGEGHLTSVTLEQGGSTRTIACDFLACGFGLVPSLELGALFDCAVEGGCIRVDAQQRTSMEGVWAAGESTGIGGLDKALAEGRIAGLATIGKAVSSTERHALARAKAFAQLLDERFAPAPALRTLCTPSTIVCRCEDVRASELAPHAGWRAAKLQTRAGMGPCQGRVCGAACEFLYGWDAPGPRPPVFPASVATLAAVQDPP